MGLYEGLREDTAHWAVSVTSKIDTAARELNVQMLRDMVNDAPQRTGTMKNSFRTFTSSPNSSTARKIYGVRAGKTRASVMHLVAFGHRDANTGRMIPGDDFPGRIHDKYQQMLEDKIKEIMEG